MPPLGYIVAVNFIGEKKKEYEKKTTTLSKITNKLLSHIHVVILNTSTRGSGVPISQ
jgi:hypothetical protein